MKICMLGGRGVGKTSLVQQFVHSIFMDRHLSATGVRISKKSCPRMPEAINLHIWDIEEETEGGEIRPAYLNGAAGFLLVADGTRPHTLDLALDLRSRAIDLVGIIPHVILINKVDLGPAFILRDQDLIPLQEIGITYFKTSAKTGLAVNEAFCFMASL